MAIRMTGMISNLDTDAIVKALMMGQTAKKTKVEAKKQKLEWKQELWSDMNKKVYNFYKTSLSKIKMQSTYKTKNATSSDASKMTATAGTGASEGSYRIKVNEVASAQYVTSARLSALSDGSAVSSSTKLKDLAGAGFGVGTQINISAKNGENNVSLLVDDDTTVADFVAAAKNAGLNASFDATQQRFFIGSDTSGKDQKFTISSASLSTDQVNAVSRWKNAVGYQYLSSTDKTAVSKIFDGLQAGTVTLDDETKEKLKTYVDTAKTTAVTDYYRDQIKSNYTSRYFTGEGESRDVTAAGEAALLASGKTQDEIDQLRTDGKLVDAVDSLVSSKVSAAMSSDDIKTEINVAIASGVSGGTVSANIGDTTEIFTIAAGSDSFLSGSSSALKSSLISTASSYNATMSGATDNSSALSALGLGKVTGAAQAESSSGVGMVVTEAKDAEITFNGATLTSSTSTLNVNGLSLNILDKTDSEITVNVTKDTSAVYDAIKDFLSEYNDILKSMSTSYNAESAKGYDILTDEQKESMSDDEVEKWNNKIKSSLLRRDDTLNSLISSFRNNMMTSVTASNGKRYSLASLGITTSTDYKEGGLLHIKGDEDDDVYADEANTLKKMLDDDPDTAMEILSTLAGNLYNDLNKKMSSTSMSSAFTFYNDKTMTKEMTQYKKDISKWETKLADLEERYYKQFTAMEKSLANLQSQQGSLSGFFG